MCVYKAAKKLCSNMIISFQVFLFLCYCLLCSHIIAIYYDTTIHIYITTTELFFMSFENCMLHVVQNYIISLRQI